MTRHSFLHRLLAVLTLLALLLSMSPSPSLLAQKGVQASPASATADTIAPAPVINLSASTGTAPGTVDLSWVAPGDDGTTGTASAYVVRYNTSPITESNWATSTDVSGEPSPGPAGSIESITVAGLTPSSAYYFAIKTQDEVPNTSGVSNSPRTMARSSPNATFLPLVVSSAMSVTPVIPDTTEVLPPETTQYLSSISGDGAVYTFTQSTPELEALAPGDIMVGDLSTNAPYGFLRQVTSVSLVGGQVIVETEGATLEEAIETGSLHVSTVLKPDQVRGAALPQGVTLVTAPELEDEFYIELKDVVLYDDDGNLNTKNDQITADGSIRLAPGFDFDLEVRDFELQELSFTMEAVETTDLEIKCEVELVSAEAEIEIPLPVHLPVITVWVGWVPVVVVPELTLHVGAEGNVHVGIRTGVTQEATLRAGLEYRQGAWSPISQFSNGFHFNPPELYAEMALKGYAGPQLELLLYGMVGPYANLDAYLELEADPAAAPWWTLWGGLEVPVGVKVEVLGHTIGDYEAMAIGYRLALAQAQDNNPPDLPSNPTPADGATDQIRNVNPSWTGGDLDGDAVTYDVYFEANDTTPDVLVSNDQAGTTYDPGMLAANTHYYWQIVAQDEHGATNAGPVWDFVTGSSINNPPYTPSDPSPADDATDQSTDVDLDWTGGDPDGDTVTYDVYLEVGDSTPDVLICDDAGMPFCDPGTLSYGELYYWKVVAKDEYGATTSGPVWDFATENCPIDLTLFTPQVTNLDVTINGVVLSDCSLITGINWQWGDGQSDDQWFPASHTYAVSGTYPVTVTAYNNLGDAEVATTTVYAGLENTLLHEDFESGTDGWEPFLNYWRLHPEQWYLQAGSGYGGSTGLRHSAFLGVADPEQGAHDALYMYRGAGSETWSDYRIEARVRMEDGRYMGLWIRGKYMLSDLAGRHVEGYYVAWQLGHSTSSVYLLRIKNSGDYAYHFADTEIIAIGDRLMNLDTWYDISVEVRGNNIKVFVDGDLILAHDDATYASGTIGLYAYQADYATWDDIVVTSLDQ